jgi:hypothetical protein
VSKPIEGGSAFPCGNSGMSISYDDGHTEWQYPGSSGMSLRQYYIGQALAGFCANSSVTSREDKHRDLAHADWIAGQAIEQADALMKRLSEEAKEPKP